MWKGGRGGVGNKFPDMDADEIGGATDKLYESDGEVQSNMRDTNFRGSIPVLIHH